MPPLNDSRMLTLTQWLSPAFPIGAFAFSHGIETAVHERWITDESELETWLHDCLTEGSGRSDVIFLRLAYAAENACEINAMARAFSSSEERRREAERQGAAFVATVNAVWGYAMPSMLLPVAVGRAAGASGIDLDATASLYLQSFVTNLVLAAVRLCPLGQTVGQRVILRLQKLCLEVAAETKNTDASDICSNAFLSDVAAMKHETHEPRLFQS